MPLLDLQKSLRMLGKIRMGETRKTANGKSYPAKLSNWRLTSPSYELLEVVAHVYGGEVSIWEGAPTEGRQYEVFTETDRLQVIVPPANALLQSYEQWSAGGCTRRCDGVTEELSGKACLCPADHDERAKLAAKGGACKITSRLKVLLPDIPDIGVWMLESHGYYAATELAGFEEIMAMATVRGSMIPAQLRIDQRTVKRNGETRRYAVPVLELVSVTAHQLARGEVAALGTGSRELEAPRMPAPALPVGERVPPRQDAPEARGRAEGGPPAPPLPHELVSPAPPQGEGTVEGDGPVSPPGPGPSSSPNRVAIAAREAGLSDDERHDLCLWASQGRTSSSKLLENGEITHAIDACRKIGAGHALLVANNDGTFTLRDTRFGFAADDPATGSDAPVTVEDMPLDELRAQLRSRLEALGDAGKKGWKDAGLPALSRLGEEHREKACRTVWQLEGEPF